MNANFKSWPVVLILSLVSLPLLIMFVFQVTDTFTNPVPGSIWPQSFTLEHWSFLWEEPEPGRANIWGVTWNTFVFATTTAVAVTAISLTAAYALSRLNFPARRFFLGGLIVLHAFPTITLIIAIFLICTSRTG